MKIHSRHRTGQGLIKLICLVAILQVANPVSGQDTHWSQFNMSPLTLNPAMTGGLYDLEAYINYRDQWQSVATPYKTMAGSFDMRFKNIKKKKGFLAAGLNFYNDKAGDLAMSTTQVNLHFAAHVRLNEYNTLGAGLSGGFVQRSINYSGIESGNQFNGMAYDGTLATGEPAAGNSRSYVDAGAGLLWTFNNTSGAVKVTDNHDLKINLGASIFHPHEPSYSFYNNMEKLYMKYVVHGEALISIPNTNIAFVPGFLFMRQGPSQEIYAGSMIRYKLKQDSKYTGFQKGSALSIGAYYRADDAVAASMLIEYSNYAIGVSYDINTSQLKSASSAKGGMEITLRFVNPNPFLYKGSAQSRF